MSNLAASNAERLQEDLHRAFSSSLSLVRKLLTGLLSFCLLLSKYIRGALNFINKTPNKPHEILPSDQSSSLLLSLPKDVILNCLARVPRQNYPILSHVSKSFRSFVLSPEFRQMRFSIGKDYPLFYICFHKYSCHIVDYKHFHWFSFDPNEKETNDINSIRVLSQDKIFGSSSVSIGSKIYFVKGYKRDQLGNLWIFNSWSGELSKGPNMKVRRLIPCVAVVDGKLYVMEGYHKESMQDHKEDNQVEIFDPKTQTWEYGPVNHHGEILFEGIVTEAVSVEEKVYGMRSYNGWTKVYDTKDGRYETFEMPYNEDARWRSGVCVINNVMYVYYNNGGLMWYDTKAKLWIMVQGLNMLINESIERVLMVECKGKLGFLWQESNYTINKKIWCAMIVLDKSGVEIHGTIEWSVLVGYVPNSCFLWRCLSVFD